MAPHAVDRNGTDYDFALCKVRQRLLTDIPWFMAQVYREDVEGVNNRREKQEEGTARVGGRSVKTGEPVLGRRVVRIPDEFPVRGVLRF